MPPRASTKCSRRTSTPNAWTSTTRGTAMISAARTPMARNRPRRVPRRTRQRTGDLIPHAARLGVQPRTDLTRKRMARRGRDHRPADRGTSTPSPALTRLRNAREHTSARASKRQYSSPTPTPRPTARSSPTRHSRPTPAPRGKRASAPAFLPRAVAGPAADLVPARDDFHASPSASRHDCFRSTSASAP